MNVGSTTKDHIKEEVKPLQNEKLCGLICLRCERIYELDDPHIDSGLGCKKCLQEGFPVGLRCLYQEGITLDFDHRKSGMFRFANNLPFLNFPSIGEGNTPLVQVDKLAAEFGVHTVAIKNEGQNPIGSHKDRMSPLAVARAVSAGYRKVIASSSGNAGASLAAYAARAGIQCCIIAAPDISPIWAEAITLAGAELRLVEGKERWPLMEKLVQNEGWFPVTNFHAQPVGSNPFGIEGYKTIAFEILEQAGAAPPTVVVVPTCRGDMLFGIFRGFVEAVESGLISRVPCLVAAEPGKRLELVLTGSDYRSVFPVAANNMTSIDGGTATYQSVKALEGSGGSAVSVTSNDAIAAQKVLAENGFYIEMSSAAALAGLQQLKVQGKLKADDNVVLIATSHGFKETPQASLPTGMRDCN
jgi:threonine synthase